MTIVLKNSGLGGHGLLRAIGIEGSNFAGVFSSVDSPPFECELKVKKIKAGSMLRQRCRH